MLGWGGLDELVAAVPVVLVAVEEAPSTSSVLALVLLWWALAVVILEPPREIPNRSSKSPGRRFPSARVRFQNAGSA